MKRMIGAILTVVLALSSLAGVAAQDAETAYGTGINSPASWFDDRGNAIATAEVTEVNDNWTEYQDNSAPDRGYVYYAVSITVTNVSSNEIELNSNDFSLIDSMGLSVGRANVSSLDDAATPAFTDRIPLATDESIDVMLVFELFNDVSPALLLWAADSWQNVLFNLSDGTVESSAVVTGVSTLSTSTDEQGNPTASLEVTGITDDWQDYDANQEPDRGARYVAVSFTVTNLTGDDMEVHTNHFTLTDTEGAVQRNSNVRLADGAETELLETTDLAPGESIDGTLVFHLFSGVEPVSLMMQSDNRLYNVVIVVEGDAAETPAAEPQATPAG